MNLNPEENLKIILSDWMIRKFLAAKLIGFFAIVDVIVA